MTYEISQLRQAAKKLNDPLMSRWLDGVEDKWNAEHAEEQTKSGAKKLFTTEELHAQASSPESVDVLLGHVEEE